MRHQVLSKIMPPLYNYISTSSNGFSDEIIQTILELGSDTEDNINCRDHIEYGVVSERDYAKKGIHGFKIKGKNILISDIMNVIEDLELPVEIQDEYPSLTNKEWDAITRIITMLLLSLESPLTA